MGTARGRTQGSCLPWAFKRIGLKFLSKVSCFLEIVAVGLKTTFP